MPLLRTITTATLLVGLALGSAGAQQGNAKGQQKKAGDPDRPAAAAKGRRDARADVRGDARRDDDNSARRAAQAIDPRQASPGARGRAAAPPKGGTPPGLAKKGGLPPGQAKKIDDGMWTLRDVLRRRGYTVTRLSRSNDLRYVYYRLPDGTIRRAAVRPEADRIGFDNVPAVVLRDVLARLY